jgi:hypothetical protein
MRADFKGIRKLADACGDNFKLGVVLFDGRNSVHFGDRLVAAPMSCLWGVTRLFAVFKARWWIQACGGENWEMCK